MLHHCNGSFSSCPDRVYSSKKKHIYICEHCRFFYTFQQLKLHHQNVFLNNPSAASNQPPPGPNVKPQLNTFINSIQASGLGNWFLKWVNPKEGKFCQLVNEVNGVRGHVIDCSTVPWVYTQIHPEKQN